MGSESAKETRGEERCGDSEFAAISRPFFHYYVFSTISFGLQSLFLLPFEASFSSGNTPAHILASSDYIDQHATVQIQLMFVKSHPNIPQLKWSNSPLSSSSPSWLSLQPALPGLVA